MYGRITMSFNPFPDVHLYHMSASIAAGFLRMSATLVAASISAAPLSIVLMSIPCKAAGSSPTAANSLVRPPTQSHIGKNSKKPRSLA